MLDLTIVDLQGVPVIGYLFWTISDNWEWADGYGPKFGLVAVDRANNLARIPRPSYHLFTKVTVHFCFALTILVLLETVVVFINGLDQILISGSHYR